jgi:Na+/glutamate symporter
MKEIVLGGLTSQLNYCGIEENLHFGGGGHGIGCVVRRSLVGQFGCDAAMGIQWRGLLARKGPNLAVAIATSGLTRVLLYC